MVAVLVIAWIVLDLPLAVLIGRVIRRADADAARARAAARSRARRAAAT